MTSPVRSSISNEIPGQWPRKRPRSITPSSAILRRLWKSSRDFVTRTYTKPTLSSWTIISRTRRRIATAVTATTATMATRAPTIHTTVLPSPLALESLNSFSLVTRATRKQNTDAMAAAATRYPGRKRSRNAPASQRTSKPRHGQKWTCCSSISGRRRTGK